MENTLVELFEKTVEKNGKKTAVIFDDGRPQSVKKLSYQNVSDQSLQVIFITCILIELLNWTMQIWKMIVAVILCLNYLPS